MPRPRPTAFEVSFGKDASRPGQSTSLRETVTPSETTRNSPFADNTQSHMSRSARPSSTSHQPYRERSTAKAGGAASRPLSSASTTSMHSRSSTLVPSLSGSSPGSSFGGRKRKPHTNDSFVTSQPGKRPRIHELGNISYITETESTTILGEDPREEFSQGEKPIRLLTDFRIFDPRHDEEITLNDLTAAEGDAGGSRFEAVGHVAPIYEEEEAGQDDDYVDTIANTSEDPHWLRTSAIINYSIDYVDADSPVYLQTAYAWYMLGMPSESEPRYKEKYLASYKPHRMAQLVISSAYEYPEETFSQFKDRFLGSYDYAAHTRITERDLINCASTLCIVLEDPALQEASQSQLIKDLLSTAGLELRTHRRQSIALPPHNPAVKTRSYVNNIDLQVLRPENQNRTYVTPFIDSLSRGLFREKLRVAGHSRSQERPKKPEKRYKRERLLNCLTLAQKSSKYLNFASADRKYGEYWNAVTIGDIKYCVGDVVLATAGQYPGRNTPFVPDIVNDRTIPRDHTLADYFWFGQLIWINQRTKTAHVQWMEHASKTYLQEIHDPQELFMVEICGGVDLQLIVGKVNVHYWGDLTQQTRVKARSKLDYKSFFYCYTYDQALGTFYNVDRSASPIQRPPDNCALCLKLHERSEQNYGRQLKSSGITAGVAYRGERYHINDFALIKTDSPVCVVGQVLKIAFRSQSCTLLMRILGRICDIQDVCPDELKDERHLFLTDMQMDVPLEDIMGPCKVMNAHELPSDKLHAWLRMSPYHLFVRYHFPSLEVRDLSDRTILKGRHAQMFEICKFCYDEDLQKEQLRQEYTSRHPDTWQLRTFDPFGGVGAFALSMQQAGCMQLTHAVEISPSAAKTLRVNSPHTTVYNQCANTVLEYAFKYAKHKQDPSTSAPQAPRTIDKTGELPEPPRPRDIDCITAGFPCQPHSRMNMFQKANDRKSNLILNLLSWVDFLKPKYCFFENVRGFLKFNLNSVQVDQYRVEGGIEMGGLKFVVRAMIAMGYQVEIGLLQAAHYGTPQARVRFFLVAAKLGLVLPKLPQPLYHFPIKDSLEIKFLYGLTIRPINTESGIALFDTITVDDAISDLPRFDWNNPRKPDRPRRDPESQKSIPIIDCAKAKASCGPRRVPYHHKPRTLFQQIARQPKSVTFGEFDDGGNDAGESLQHFTRVLKDDVIARVVHIPLRAKADYRALFGHEFRHLWEWQMSDPKSATARHGYRPGMYGRLDKDGWFQTTVTNVEPTAKQSWVLNPYCKRVVTVRELARSQGFPDYFKFYCVTADVVKTMHREIGNAVPWPVGLALGRELGKAMFKHWLDHEREEENLVIE